MPVKSRAEKMESFMHFPELYFYVLIIVNFVFRIVFKKILASGFRIFYSIWLKIYCFFTILDYHLGDL